MTLCIQDIRQHSDYMSCAMAYVRHQLQVNNFLLSPRKLVVSPPVISSNVFAAVLRMLSSLSSSSPPIAVELLKLGKSHPPHSLPASSVAVPMVMNLPRAWFTSVAILSLPSLLLSQASLTLCATCWLGLETSPWRTWR